MARPKKGSGSKAQSIRDEIQANPAAKTSEIVKVLAGKGIKVLPNQVYAIKALGNVKKKKQQRAAAGAVASDAGMPNPAEAIIQVRAFAVRFGGMKKLKQIVDLLAE